MIIVYIIIGVVIYVAWGVIKELFFGYSSGKSTLDRPGNLEKCGREMVGKSQKECRKILNKYRE